MSFFYCFAQIYVHYVCIFSNLYVLSLPREKISFSFNVRKCLSIFQSLLAEEIRLFAAKSKISIVFKEPYLDSFFYIP